MPYEYPFCDCWLLGSGGGGGGGVKNKDGGSVAMFSIAGGSWGPIGGTDLTAAGAEVLFTVAWD